MRDFRRAEKQARPTRSKQPVRRVPTPDARQDGLILRYVVVRRAGIDEELVRNGTSLENAVETLILRQWDDDVGVAMV